LTITNSIVAGNTTNGSEDDCSGSCANGVNGNVEVANAMLAPLGNYGGFTQTLLPLPGSPAICAGLIADIPSGVTTDQRGLPRTTTYSGMPCVDSGPIQTSYSVSFITDPPSTIPAYANFAAALQLSESGSPFPMSGVAISIALAAADDGTLNVSSLITSSSGFAAASQLQVGAPGTDDMLVATLPLTASGITRAATRSATSTAFDVTPSNSVQVTSGRPPWDLPFWSIAFPIVRR